MTTEDLAELRPSLLRSRAPRRGGRRPRGLVLMLHGGAEHDATPITRWHRPWLRSLLMMRQIASGLHRDGLDVWLLRYRHVGWNAASRHHSPVPDARWALDQARATYDATEGSVVLLGHSMGARTSVAVADDPLVRGVVGLAPWFPSGEPVAPLAGKRLVAAHGRADRITGFADTERFVARAARVARSAELVDMGDLGHYMLQSLGDWNSVAQEQARAMFAD